MNSVEYVKKQPYLRVREIIVLSVIIVLTAVFVIFYFTGNRGQSVEIYQQDKLLYSYPLEIDRIIDVDGILTVVIQNKSVYVSRSTCPDQLCVHNSPIKYSGNSIICLPNQIIIKISGKSDIDGMV